MSTKYTPEFKKQAVALYLKSPTTYAAVARALRGRRRDLLARTPNGCGHRQIAMCLRAERGTAIADKTVLKMICEMGMNTPRG